MWDTSAPSAGDEAVPFEENDPAARVAWTDGQLMRLESEWHRAQRAFAYHPVIGLSPLRGDPPHEYQLDFRTRSLVINEAGELQYVDQVSMHVWLPPGFPNQAPLTRPMAEIFHPNISYEGVFVTQLWQPTDTLVDYAARIGELLTFRKYDPQSVVNSTAMDWVTENHGALPLDNRADFSPYAGGEPIGRITRMGPGTLDQIRRALDDMRGAFLEEETAPSGEDVVEFARQTRAAVSLFLDSDVPDPLRQQAVEFDSWCRELPASVPLWQYCRQQRSRAARAEAEGALLKDAAAALTSALGELEALVKGPMPQTPAATVRMIPPMQQLQPLQLKLSPLVRNFELHMADLRALLEEMKQGAPVAAVDGEGSLGRRLASQQESAAQTVRAATDAALSAIRDVDPAARRARPELAALDAVVGWRDYMDLFGKARRLEQQIGAWGSAGVHAWFLTNASGTFGPFQFEEPVDLGGTRIAVRNWQGAHIEVIDAVSHELLAKSPRGNVNLLLGSAEAGGGHETALGLTGRCDDLTIQLDFIQKQTLEALGKLQRSVSGTTSWCGVVSRLLSDHHQQQNLREAHRKAGHRWKALMTDMAHLLRFKERLATYHLVARTSDDVARVKELIAAQGKRLEEATRIVQGILGKSSRDPETDQFIIPPRLAKSYADELRNRDQARHETARLHALLKQMARDLSTRLSEPRWCGRPEVPKFRALAAVPEAMAALEADMSDEALWNQVDALGRALGVALPLNLPPASSVPALRGAAPASAAPSDGAVRAAMGNTPVAPGRPARPAGPPTSPPQTSVTPPSAASDVRLAEHAVAGDLTSSQEESIGHAFDPPHDDFVHASTFEASGHDEDLAAAEGADDIVADFFGDERS